MIACDECSEKFQEETEAQGLSNIKKSQGNFEMVQIRN